MPTNDIIIDPSGKQHEVQKFGYGNGTHWGVGESVPPSSFEGNPDTYAIKLKDDELYVTVIGHVIHEITDGVHYYPAQKTLFNHKGTRVKYMAKAEEDKYWPTVEKVLHNADRVLLYGVPGTGKTTTAFLVDPDRTDKVTLTEETPASALLGHWVPEGDHFRWHDGIAINAWKKGRRLLVDEVDRGSGDVQTLLYAIADDPMVARLTLPTGEIVTPAPGFAIVITMNGVPNDLPDALVDRFSTMVNIDRPHPKAIESLPKDLQQIAMNSFLVKGSRSASIRSWKAFADLRTKTDEETAAFAVFGTRAKELLTVIKMSR